MADCVFCGSSATGGWIPPFAEMGICRGCWSDLVEKLAKDSKLGLNGLKGDIAEIRASLR